MKPSLKLINSKLGHGGANYPEKPDGSFLTKTEKTRCDDGKQRNKC